MSPGSFLSSGSACVTKITQTQVAPRGAVSMSSALRTRGVKEAESASLQCAQINVLPDVRQIIVCSPVYDSVWPGTLLQFWSVPS